MMSWRDSILKINYKKLYESRLEEIRIQMITSRRKKDWRAFYRLREEQEQLLERVKLLEEKENAKG